MNQSIMKTSTLITIGLTGVCTSSSSEAFTFGTPSVRNAAHITNNRNTQIFAATVPDNNDMPIFQEDDNDTPEKELPQSSQSIPFLARPKELKLEMAGDVGFDPLGFATNRDLLMEYREAEIKHSRLAMLAAIGWPASELYDVKVATLLHKEPILDATDRVPSLFSGGMDKISPVYWGFVLGLTAAIDLYGVSRARSGVKGYIPGDLGFDPLGLYPAEDDVEGRMKMQLAEIKHGRLSMIAVLAFTAQELVTGKGVIDETPLFFKPIEVLEEVLEEVAASASASIEVLEEAAVSAI